MNVNGTEGSHVVRWEGSGDVCGARQNLVPD